LGKLGVGLLDAALECGLLSVTQVAVKEHDHSKRIGFLFVAKRERDFKTAVEAILVGNEVFLLMLLQGLCKQLRINRVHGGRGHEKALMIMDVDHVFEGY